jgi:hypothetical protein
MRISLSISIDCFRFDQDDKHSESLDEANCNRHENVFTFHTVRME